MEGGGKNKIKNSLKLIRKRRGLAQKHLAYLLGQRSTDQISCYEKSKYLPKLRTALKLEIVLGAPVRVLFADLYDALRKEVHKRAKMDSSLRTTLSEGVGDANCSFLELLLSPQLSPEDLSRVRRHAIELHEKLGDVIAKSRQDGAET